MYAQKNTLNESLICTLGFTSSTIFLTPWLQFISLLNFMRLLFKGGIYFFGKSTGINDSISLLVLLSATESHKTQAALVLAH